MVFSSISFLYYFLPIVIVLYFILPFKMKNILLFVSSLFFYFCGEQLLVSIMIISALTDYTASRVIEANRDKKLVPKLALIVSLVINLGLLCYFKYADFFISNLNGLLHTDIPLLNIALPIGISFYTFQTMSYTIDVYLGHVTATKSICDFGTYVTLFPQLIAGPIVRYSTIAEELKERTHSFENFAYGTRRFILGLAKKVVLANTFAVLGKTFLYTDDKSVLFYWLFAIAFFFQIYFDFSGYSDMAIGLGRMFGFHFLENFNYPYIATSITDFWRRWHMSLSTWFRDYVYIPLGGNRVSRGKWIRNIILVWFLTGFWHGASWNFILWGLYYAVLLVLEKLFLNKVLAKLPRFLCVLYSVFFVLIGFVIFNANTFTECWNNLYYMFGGGNLPLANEVSLYYLKSYRIVFIISIIAATPLTKNIILNLRVKKAIYDKTCSILEPFVLLLLLLLVTGFLVDGSFNPFLYFRF